MVTSTFTFNRPQPEATAPVDTGRLEQFARKTRRRLLTMHFEAKSNHLASGLSAIEILLYLHSEYLRREDRFILSKGHAASAWYATLWALEQITDEEIATYYRDNTMFPAHPAAGAHDRIIAATGSLGHGLPISTGLALAAKWNKNDHRVACLLSDGECNEGTVWEGALFAAQHELNNLTVFIDANGWQGFGRNADVLNLEPLADKWRAFGFRVSEIAGHDFHALHEAMTAEAADRRPHCVICRTVKGKGVSYMEDTLDWHYKTMSPEQFAAAIAEIDLAEQTAVKESHAS